MSDFHLAGAGPLHWLAGDEDNRWPVRIEDGMPAALVRRAW